ncbi:MAG TPA: competence protein CoiA family protein [Polyangiaceae bacterium]
MPVAPGDAPASSFAVPWALTALGTLVDPEAARPRARYRCPQCQGPVDLHAGEQKRRHFHHRGTTGCTSESVLHTTAKQLLVEAVTAWKTGGEPPRLERRCAVEGCESTTRQALPAKVMEAACERAVGGYVVDVVLLGRGGVPVAAIEVFHTHAVGAEKARALLLPWVELDASQVCATGGRLLVPVRDKLLPWLCEEHAPERRERAKQGREAPLRRNALVRRLALRMEDYPGFRIEKVVACPRGHDALVFAWDGGDPPWPRPPLVVARGKDADWKYGSDGKVRKVLAYKRSYASVCPDCGEVVE